MLEGPTLFDVTGSESTQQAPSCPVCERPVPWMPRAGRWAGYCTHNGCTSPVRICKQCRRSYPRASGGTRYCSVECRVAWTGPRLHQARVLGHCSHCEGERMGTNTWDLCGGCYARVESVAVRLRKHHVPITLVSRLLEDPTCWNPGCDQDLVTPYRNGSGRVDVALVVDHDHRHCPGPFGCGLCVRGLLCARCNTALGMLGENPERIGGLAAYLGMTG